MVEGIYGYDTFRRKEDEFQPATPHVMLVWNVALVLNPTKPVTFDESDFSYLSEEFDSVWD